LNLGQIELLAN